ncbi:putative spore germination protein [Gracilibacillus halophilus YIM-C55.5]|uniref:Putative spore germination protein n=1 Tax=Gracilibacillus halophilus YIM-C55.5 TaxID=1308866 RepID=N4WME5_9BACI|nr:germination protein YpeB [Gracilibacillus halophilus]ENH97357.1 putative spore germination protein [Gracilibacillus halophilus YIM-C55.5]
MFRWVVIGVLSIGLIGVSIWGYQEHQEKNEVMIQAENAYQRSFHDLAYHLDLLHDKIGSALAMNSRERLSPQLVEIWRLTSQAHGDVGQLPLAFVPFNKTEEFLSQMGDFSYRTAVRDLDQKPLNDEEIETLESLYEMSGEIEKEIRSVQNLVLKDQLRWMDVQLALANKDEPGDNTILDGFQTVENKVEGYSEGKIHSSLMGTSSKEDSYQMIKGDKFNQSDAKQKMREILGINQEINLNIEKTGEGAKVSMYSGSFQTDKKSGYLDITEQGGYPVTVMINRTVDRTNVSLHEATQKAKTYLNKLDFNDLALVESNQYDHVGVFHFVPNNEDVWVYPDAIQVKVALDNGNVIGMVAKDYLENHGERDIPKPTISEKEAREVVNPNVEIQDHHLAVIEDDTGVEVLTYVFLGVKNQDTYKIFVNAENGTEERVERLKQKEVKYEKRKR